MTWLCDLHDMQTPGIGSRAGLRSLQTIGLYSARFGLLTTLRMLTDDEGVIVIIAPEEHCLSPCNLHCKLIKF
jgi:hypothetical protein